MTAAKLATLHEGGAPLALPSGTFFALCVSACVAAALVIFLRGVARGLLLGVLDAVRMVRAWTGNRSGHWSHGAHRKPSKKGPRP
jgi:hypothetical protein